MTEEITPVTLRDHIECGFVDVYWTVKGPLQTLRATWRIRLRNAWLGWRYRYISLRNWIHESWTSRPALFGDAFEVAIRKGASRNLLDMQHVDEMLAVLPPDRLN